MSDPAFPVPMVPYPGGGSMNVDFKGMSLRDWYAGLAMQGWLATFVNEDPRPHQLAGLSFDIADAMIAARASRP